MATIAATQPTTAVANPYELHYIALVSNMQIKAHNTGTSYLLFIVMLGSVYFRVLNEPTFKHFSADQVRWNVVRYLWRDLFPTEAFPDSDPMPGNTAITLPLEPGANATTPTLLELIKHKAFLKGITGQDFEDSLVYYGAIVDGMEGMHEAEKVWRKCEMVWNTYFPTEPFPFQYTPA